MVEWPIKTLGEVAAQSRGAISIGPFGSRMKADCYAKSGTAVIRGTNLSGGKIWKGDWVFVPDEFAATLPNCLVHEGDLVLPHRGSIGEVGIVPRGSKEYLISSSLMKISLDPKRVSHEFAFYYLSSTAGRQEIMRFSSQVGTPGIGQPLASLRQVRIPCPPLDEQLAIVTVLAALDDKIELNRQMNATLELIARAFFKDWFVDFGPIRAKLDGHPPYLTSEVWDLFPCLLDEDGKPEGWSLGTLGSVARRTGATISPEKCSSETPYFGLEHMPRRSLALCDWDGAAKVSSAKTSFVRGDILFGKLRPYFHKVGIAPINGICSTDIVVLDAKQKAARAYVACCVSSDDFVAYTDRLSAGTKMPRTSWEQMKRFSICVPPDVILAEFQKLVAPCIDKIIDNVHESRRLGAIRDLLLPKLMSGEIRVKDAQQMLADVA